MFGFTSCADVCPGTLRAVHRALEQLGPDAAGLEPVFITVDPQRDSPERLAAYVESFDPRIRAFTGSEAAISRAAAALRVVYRVQRLSDRAGDYTIDHTALVFLLDADRRLVASIPENLPIGELSARIVREFRDATGS